MEAVAAGRDVEVPQAPKRFRINERYCAPLLITCILLVAQLAFGVLESVAQAATAILTCMAAEIVLTLIFARKLPNLASAYITGISISLLIRSPFVWPYALCALIAITSKYLLRVDKRRLWNPSNFAICVMLIIAHDFIATLSVQFDNKIWATAIVWIVGSVIISRLKRFHICLTYAVSFFAFAALRSLIAHSSFIAEIAPITGPMDQLFIFLMITDPATTVRTKRGQIIVAFPVAAAECVLRLAGNVHAPYYALAIVGPIANLVEIASNRRKRQTVPTLAHQTSV